jgi:hypothetical protein
MIIIGELINASRKAIKAARYVKRVSIAFEMNAFLSYAMQPVKQKSSIHSFFFTRFTRTASVKSECPNIVRNI